MHALGPAETSSGARGVRPQRGDDVGAAQDAQRPAYAETETVAARPAAAQIDGATPNGEHALSSSDARNAAGGRPV